MLLIHEPRTTTDDLLSKALDGSGIVSFCEPVFIAYQRSRPAANLALHSDQSTVLMWWSSGDSDVLAAGNVFALSIDLQQRCIVPLRETSTASYIYDMWFSRCTNDLIYTIEGQSSNIDDFSIKLVFYNATFSPSPRVSPAPLLEYVDAFPLALSAPLVAHAMNSSETVFALATLNKELHVFDLQRQQSFTSALLMEASTLLWDDTDSVLIVGSRTGVLQLFDQLAMPLHLISMSDGSPSSISVSSFLLMMLALLSVSLDRFSASPSLFGLGLLWHFLHGTEDIDDLSSRTGRGN
eukprot:m.511724 g.511724  ORF g.511724 m.511724 type:complete len:295 (-) comp57432_c0_seq6:726-1610(-)